MTTIDIQDLSPQLAELLRRAAQGEEVVIVEDNTPVARLVPIGAVPTPRIAGLHRGTVWMSDDFDEPLDDAFWAGEA